MTEATRFAVDFRIETDEGDRDITATISHIGHCDLKALGQDLIENGAREIRSVYSEVFPQVQDNSQLIPVGIRKLDQTHSFTVSALYPKNGGLRTETIEAADRDEAEFTLLWKMTQEQWDDRLSMKLSMDELERFLDEMNDNIIQDVHDENKNEVVQALKALVLGIENGDTSEQLESARVLLESMGELPPRLPVMGA